MGIKKSISLVQVPGALLVIGISGDSIRLLTQIEDKDLLDQIQKEETGLSAANWAEIMRLHPSNSITDELGIIYLATELTEGEPEFEETEDLEIRKLALVEAVAMVNTGEITDAISAAALLRIAAIRTAASP